MTRTHTIGTLAAIGGVTATIALLTGLPAASADEMADLRANQELLQRRIDQLAQGQPPAAGGIPGGGPGSPYGAQATPGVPVGGGSFPRSFLIPGTDTSIRVGGFIDLTGLYFLQGANSGNPGTPSSNSGQNGNLNALPIGQVFVPGLGNVAQQANHSRGNGVFMFSPQQSRLNVETRTPTAWGELRTFLEFDWSGSNNFSCQTVQYAGGNSLLPAPQIRLRHVGRVPCRPGDLELLRCRRRHRIDGIRRRRWARPAAYASRRCATPLRVRMAAPSRFRRNNRPSTP